jgi:hypothetical protein
MRRVGDTNRLRLLRWQSEGLPANARAAVRLGSTGHALAPLNWKKLIYYESPLPRFKRFGEQRYG